MKRLRTWWAANVIATDPNPEYSRLDHLDGLITDPAAFDALARRMFPGAAQ